MRKDICIFSCARQRHRGQFGRGGKGCSGCGSMQIHFVSFNKAHHYVNTVNFVRGCLD